MTWSTVISLLIALLVGLVVGWLVTSKGIKPNQTGQSTINKTILFLLLTLFFLLIGAGFLINTVVSNTKINITAEVQMGLLVVVAIAALMTVLFILAAGFSSMNLTDPKQALGLPEGSIRAMIALVLIMVFILFGIYLFREVGEPVYSLIETKDYKPNAEDYKPFRVQIEPDLTDSTKTKYKVYSVTEISDDGRRLAQQLITTIGTLVVAVAGFYFGSSSVAAAQMAIAVSHPVIKDIIPREGVKDQQIGLEIVGTDFKSPKTVSLHRGNEVMFGTEVMSNTTKIQCKIKIDKEPDGKWDVIVENEDGKEARLNEIFTIKNA